MLRGEMRQQEIMAKHTSWKVGGPARQFYRPADREDLSVFLSGLSSNEKIEWVGLGSNLLVRDKGFNGTIINTKGCLTDIDYSVDNYITAESGVSCAVIARQAARKGLVGLEFFAGIPGTVGGALAMNAGAFGGETWDKVESVEMINRKGEITLRYPEEFKVSYREVVLPEKDEWFLSVNFKLSKGDVESAQTTIKKLMEKRGNSQPIGLASCGSTFRNPKGNHAAKLIEECGLKSMRVGGASVSDKHANFLINEGDATASDIEELVVNVQDKVFEQTGVKLQREFHIVGELNS